MLRTYSTEESDLHDDRGDECADIQMISRSAVSHVPTSEGHRNRNVGSAVRLMKNFRASASRSDQSAEKTRSTLEKRGALLLASLHFIERAYLCTYRI